MKSREFRQLRKATGCFLGLVLASCGATSSQVVSDVAEASSPVAPATQEATASPVLSTTAGAGAKEVTTPETTPESTTSELAVTGGGLLFSCLTAQNKVIEVNDLGESIQYRFGPDAEPELVLAVPRDRVSTYQWQGIGRYENYSVSIPNGDTVYSVFWSRDRLEGNADPESGVVVEIDGEYIITVNCATNAVHNLIGIDLPPTEF